MSEEPSSNPPGSPPGGSVPEGDSTFDERTRSRAERRAERRSRRGGAPWILGAILIVLGVGSLAKTYGLIAFNNWWALFILIPAVGSFAAAGRRYQAAGGRMTSGAIGSLIGGLVLSAVAMGFLFNLDLGLNWNLVWPLLLILGGLALLLQYATR